MRYKYFVSFGLMTIDVETRFNADVVVIMDDRITVEQDIEQLKKAILSKVEIKSLGDYITINNYILMRELPE